MEETSRNNILLAIVIILLVLCIWKWAPGPWDHMDRLANRTVAQQLTDEGWELYIRTGCPWCHRQLDEFMAEEQAQLKVTDCQKTPEACPGVQGVPLWRNKKTGQSHSGYRPKAGLVELLLKK